MNKSNYTPEELKMKSPDNIILLLADNANEFALLNAIKEATVQSMKEKFQKFFKELL